MAKGKSRVPRRVTKIETVTNTYPTGEVVSGAVVHYECLPMGCKHKTCLGTFAGWAGKEESDDKCRAVSDTRG